MMAELSGREITTAAWKPGRTFSRCWRRCGRRRRLSRRRRASGPAGRGCAGSAGAGILSLHRGAAGGYGRAGEDAPMCTKTDPPREIERKFLLKRLPDGLADYPHAEI